MLLGQRMRATGIASSWALVDNALGHATNNDTYQVEGVNFGDAASNRYLILLVTGHDAKNETSYSMSATIGGINADKVASKITGDGSDAVHSGIYIAHVPTGSSGTIVHTLTSYGGTYDDFGYSLFRVTGLVSPTPLEIWETNADPSITIPSNGFGIIGYSSHTSTCSDWTGGNVVNIQKGGRYASHAYDLTAGGPNTYSSSGGGPQVAATWQCVSSIT